MWRWLSHIEVDVLWLELSRLHHYFLREGEGEGERDEVTQFSWSRCPKPYCLLHDLYYLTCTLLNWTQSLWMKASAKRLKSKIIKCMLMFLWTLVTLINLVFCGLLHCAQVNSTRTFSLFLYWLPLLPILYTCMNLISWIPRECWGQMLSVTILDSLAWDTVLVLLDLVVLVAHNCILYFRDICV